MRSAVPIVFVDLDEEVPADSRLLGYAIVRPGDRLDYPQLFAEHCDRQSSDLAASLCVRDLGRTDSDAPCVTVPAFGRGLTVARALSERLDIFPRALGGLEVVAVLAAIAPEIVEPDVTPEALFEEYCDDDVAFGSDRAC